MKKSHLLILLLSTVILACNKAPELERREYVAWIEDSENEVLQIKETDNLIIKCLFMPSEYTISKEFINKLLVEADWEERNKELENTLLFKISIVTKEGKSVIDDPSYTKEEKKEREDFFRYEVEKLLQLNIDGDRKEPIIFHLERNYGIKPEVDMLAGFNIEKGPEEFTLIYKNILIDTASLEFDYDFKNIAKLIRNNN